ncbi:MAG: hypothetical protein ACM3ML_10565 [Micromonosporaceae bacterium]
MAYRQSIHVEAPVKKVFDFFTDPNNCRHVQPKGIELKGRQTHPRGLGTHYGWAAKMAGLSIEGFDVFTELMTLSRPWPGTPRWPFRTARAGDRLPQTAGSYPQTNGISVRLAWNLRYGDPRWGVAGPSVLRRAPAIPG